MRRVGLLPAAILALVAVGCGPRTVGVGLPPGAGIAGEAAAWRPLLARLGSLEGTPLATEATRLGAVLEGCGRFAAFCPAGERCDLVARIACDGGVNAPEARRLLELADDAGLVAYAAAAEGPRLLARGTVGADGSVAMTAEVSPPEERSAVSLVLPGAEPPGPARLADRDLLVHARVRPASGLSLTGLVDPGGGAARLWRLQSDIFLATALAGVWELAVYLPEEGHAMPGLAFAVDVKSREAAVTAMERFLAEVQQTWPVRRSAWRLGPWEGACLDNLNLLPEMAPCYVGTEEALVVGWNDRSVARALAPGDRDPGATSFVRAALERFPEADRRLRAATVRPPTSPPLIYPWSALTLTGTEEQGRIVLRAALPAAGGQEVPGGS